MVGRDAASPPGRGEEMTPNAEGAKEWTGRVNNGESRVEAEDLRGAEVIYASSESAECSRKRLVQRVRGGCRKGEWNVECRERRLGR